MKMPPLKIGNCVLIPSMGFVFWALLLGIGAIGCSAASSSQTIAASLQPAAPQAPPVPPMPPADPVNPKVNPQVIQANTRFGFELLRDLLQRDGNRNVFISPLSIATALAMTYNGAADKTQTAMAQALQLQGISLADLNTANAILNQQITRGDPQVKLTIANSLWIRQGTSIKDDFLKTNQTFYNAKVSWLDFAKPDALQEINHWVSQSTQGRITQILDRLTPDDVLYLINAIYFKGKWSKPFDPKQTQSKPFYRDHGQPQILPMMHQWGRYDYFENSHFQAIRLPYGDRRLSLDLFLPQQGKTLLDLTAELTPEHWQQWNEQFRPRDGSIQLPRFKLEYGTELRRSLSALGMGIAFDPQQANFSRLSPDPLFIGLVRHKTFLEVNEEGTEAAGVTAVGMTRTAAPNKPPFQMVVDRPFFCVIRDHQTGAILFMGTIVDPKPTR